MTSNDTRKHQNNRIYTYEYDFRGNIPHIGVEIFGKEYSYSVDGIQTIEPVSLTIIT